MTLVYAYHHRTREDECPPAGYGHQLSIRRVPVGGGTEPGHTHMPHFAILSPRHGARFLSSASGCMGGGRPSWTNPMQ